MANREEKRKNDSDVLEDFSEMPIILSIHSELSKWCMT